MSCKLITGSGARFQICPKPFDTTTKSSLHAYPLNVSFNNTHLPKDNNSIKTSSRSYRTTTKAVVNNMFTTTKTETTQSFYELLGISESVSLPEIKRAYKQLALKYHPDVSPPDQTEEYTRAFIRVQEAYETLSNERSRALYDMDLCNGLHLAFSARKQRPVARSEDWRDRWESQLNDLNKRSGNKNMSWGARIRNQRK